MITLLSLIYRNFQVKKRKFLIRELHFKKTPRCNFLEIRGITRLASCLFPVFTALFGTEVAQEADLGGYFTRRARSLDTGAALPTKTGLLWKARFA
jgi:hypothetical protein